MWDQFKCLKGGYFGGILEGKKNYLRSRGSMCFMIIYIYFTAIYEEKRLLASES